MQAKFCTMFSKASKANHELVENHARLVTDWTTDTLTSVKFDTDNYLEGKVAVITLARPKARNAWTEIMRNEIARCLDTASKMKKVRAIIITGEGRSFCVGMDLSPPGPNTPTSMEGDVPSGRPADASYWRDGGGTTGLAVMRCTKPVICAVNGAAVGVGMTLPLCCDMSVVSEKASVGFVFGKRGLTMECLSSYFLSRAVGHKKAMELVLTGRVFKARDSPSGLFNYIVPEDEVMKKALELAGEVCETSPMSAMLNRTMIIRNGLVSPEEAHLIESKAIFWAARQADAAEGIQSFLEKRPPNYPMDAFKDSPDWFPWWREVSTKSKL